MKTSTDTKTRLDEAPPASPVAALIAPIALPWNGRAGTEAAGDRPLPALPDSFTLHRMARAERSRLLGELIARAAGSGLRALAALWRRSANRRRERRERRALRKVWLRLADSTLRDLGFHRSQLAGMGLAAAGAAPCDAVRHEIARYLLPR